MSDEACYADDIGDYRWEGFPLEEKVGWMQGAAGSAAVAPGADALRGLSARYARSHQAVQAGLAKLGVGWQGRSAEAAAGAVTQIADWVAGAGPTLTGGGGSMGTYGASFDAMRPRIQPAPVTAHPIAGPPGLLDGMAALAGIQTPFNQQVERAAAADAQANAALRAHQQATRAALTSFPRVDPPPTVTADAVSAAPSNGSGGRVMPPAGGAAAPRVGGAGAAGGGRAGGAGPGGGPVGAGGGPVGGGAAPGTGANGGAAGGGAAGPGDRGAAASTATADAGWTPLAPAAPNTASGGLVSGPNGGLVPGPAGPAGFGAPAGGYGEAYRQPPLAPRTGGVPPRPQFGGDFGVPQPAPGRGTGPAGAVPMGMGGATADDDEPRAHRNQTFIPSDEPFRVEFFDVAPPVLGIRTGEPW